MFQVIKKSRDGSIFVLGTFATIQEANASRSLANARHSNYAYRIVQVA
jgi:glutamate racemase